MGHCPWCFMVVSFDYGCNNHGFKKQELLKDLPENWLGMHQDRVDEGSMRRMPGNYKAEIARTIGMNKVPEDQIQVEDEERVVAEPVPLDLGLEVIAEEPVEEDAIPAQSGQLVADAMVPRPRAIDLAQALATVHTPGPAQIPVKMPKYPRSN